MKKGSIFPVTTTTTCLESYCGQTWSNVSFVLHQNYVKTDDKWQNQSCFRHVKLPAMAFLFACFSVYISGVSSHCNSDQSESYSTTILSEVQLNFGSRQHFISQFGPQQISSCWGKPDQLIILPFGVDWARSGSGWKRNILAHNNPLSIPFSFCMNGTNTE